MQSTNGFVPSFMTKPRPSWLLGCKEFIDYKLNDDSDIRTHTFEFYLAKGAEDDPDFPEIFREVFKKGR